MACRFLLVGCLLSPLQAAKAMARDTTLARSPGRRLPSTAACYSLVVLNSVNQSASNLRPKAESQRRLNSHRRTWFEGAHCLSKLVHIADPNGAVRDGGTDFAAR
jgi:hypothetical protein